MQGDQGAAERARDIVRSWPTAEADDRLALVLKLRALAAQKRVQAPEQQARRAAERELRRRMQRDFELYLEGTLTLRRLTTKLRELERRMKEV